MGEGERRIPNDTAILMTAIAGFLDLVSILAELIPIVGIVIGFILDMLMTGIFYLWFAHYDVKLFGNKNAAGSLIAFVLNAFPLTDLTFPWAVRVGTLAFSAKKEVPQETAQQPSSAWRL